jgi:hypothetical protein
MAPLHQSGRRGAPSQETPAAVETPQPRPVAGLAGGPLVPGRPGGRPWQRGLRHQACRPLPHPRLRLHLHLRPLLHPLLHPHPLPRRRAHRQAARALDRVPAPEASVERRGPPGDRPTPPASSSPFCPSWLPSCPSPARAGLAQRRWDGPWPGEWRCVRRRARTVPPPRPRRHRHRGPRHHYVQYLVHRQAAPGRTAGVEARTWFGGRRWELPLAQARPPAPQRRHCRPQGPPRRPLLRPDRHRGRRVHH